MDKLNRGTSGLGLRATIERIDSPTAARGAGDASPDVFLWDCKNPFLSTPERNGVLIIRMSKFAYTSKRSIKSPLLLLISPFSVRIIICGNTKNISQFYLCGSQPRERKKNEKH
jgi:hypothetical protein